MGLDDGLADGQSQARPTLRVRTGFVRPTKPLEDMRQVLRRNPHSGEEVIRHYVGGGQRRPTLDPNLAKHPTGGVPLSEADQKALVAFLKSLTDERYRGGPERVAQVP